MSTKDLYSIPVDVETRWDVPMVGDTLFTWDYDDGRDRLLALYQKGKDKQWDSTKRIDWSIEVDPNDPAGFPEEYNDLANTDIWRKMSKKEQDEFGRHQSSWLFSQFLHGEQGAMVVSARIVETVPDLDSKFYAATQTMDEARHVEVYSKFLQEKIGLVYPMNDDLAALLKDALEHKEWDYAYLGMQVLIEGLALAAFGLYRDMAKNPLVQQILAYVMQDEARHVAFGRLSLKDYYAELSDKERAEREEFAVEGCSLMRDRFEGREVFDTLGLPTEEILEITRNSEIQQVFQSLLFSRIVPCMKDIGLWGDKVQKAYADMGVLDMAGVDLEALMRDDEDIAEKIDAAKAELALRRQEIKDTISLGASV
jgi:hypothetical protein